MVSPTVRTPNMLNVTVGVYPMFDVLDLFSGIGGFSLGLERTGMFKTAAFVEIDTHCNKVLAKHWPSVRRYRDVREVTKEALIRDHIGQPSVICGGFPCSDVSLAGRQAGIEGKKSGLWAEFSRLIGDIRPRYVIVENVANLLAGPAGRPGKWFGRVLGDLAALGYNAEWHCIPASAIGAPHQRDRVWLVAYPNSVKRRPGAGQEAFVFKNRIEARDSSQWNAEPGICRVDDGVPNGVDRRRALGNSIVPQIAEIIGYAIANHNATLQNNYVSYTHK